MEGRFFDLLEAAGCEGFRQQRVKQFVVDAIAKNANVAIEFDGTYWHSLPHVAAKDERKAIAIAWAGYKLIRVPEEAFMRDPEALVLSVIAQVATV